MTQMTSYDHHAPTLTPEQEKRTGMLAHLIPLVAMILSAGFLGFVSSAVVFVMYKDRGPFVRQNAANSLNVQLTMALVIAISIPFYLVGIGFITHGLALVVAGALHVIGALRATNGEWWTPPAPRFVK